MFLIGVLLRFLGGLELFHAILRAKIQSRGAEIIQRKLRMVGKLFWGVAPISGQNQVDNV